MISALGQMRFQMRHPLGDTWSFTGSSLCGHPAQEADPRGPLTLSLRSHFYIFQPTDACCWVSSLGDLSHHYTSSLVLSVTFAGPTHDSCAIVQSCLLQLFIFYTPSFLLKFLCSSRQKKSLSDPLHSSHPTEKLDSRLNFLHTNLISTYLCLSYSWNLSLACCLKEQKKRHTTPQL